MKKILLSILMSCSLVSARAAVSVFDAFLSGPNESPANTSPGTGFALVNFDSSLNTLQVQVLFAGLTTGTTASHIHAATSSPFTGTAGVATTTPTFAGFPLGVTSGSYSNTLDLTLASSYNPSFITANGGTTASAEAALVAAMFANESYLNIHTTTFPGGEIRGFLVLVPVPEPSTLALAGLGGLGMAARVWRRKGRARHLSDKKP
jgi:CHRD domain/PEP-CTERM motif